MRVAGVVLLCACALGGLGAVNGVSFDLGVTDVVDIIRTHMANADAAVTAFAEAKKAAGDEAGSAALIAKKDTWLCYVGWNSCITGLAKDFVVNYLGRDAYHDNNGPLIDGINELASQFAELDVDDPAGWIEMEEHWVKKSKKKLYDAAESLFDAEGNLGLMFADAKAEIDTDEKLRQFVIAAAPHLRDMARTGLTETEPPSSKEEPSTKDEL